MLRAALSGLLLIGATPTLAAPELEGIDLAAERKAIEQFQALDQKLQDIGWKLVTGNAPFCAETVPSIGLQLHDLASYGSPVIARAALGMTGSFAVQTIAKGSPAAASGHFPHNREISRMNALDPNTWETQGRSDWKRLAKVHDWIDEALQQSGAITFTFADGTTSAPVPVEVCATRFEIASGGTMAVANGERAVFGSEFPGFNYPEPLFAGVIAHELAHNLLGHRAWLKANGTSRKNVRRAEREADRLIPWLLANAGYDPAAGARFFERDKTSSGSVLFLSGTHDKWRDRVKLVEAELPQVRALMAQTGKADWATHFERDAVIAGPPAS